MASLFFFLVAAALFLGVGMLLLARRKRGIPAKKRAHFTKLWRTISAQQNAKAVLDAHSLIVQALGAHGYTGTAAERIKAAGLMQLWPMHQLRNRIAHQPGYQPPLPHIRSGLSAARSALISLSAIER